MAKLLLSEQAFIQPHGEYFRVGLVDNPFDLLDLSPDLLRIILTLSEVDSVEQELLSQGYSSADIRMVNEALLELEDFRLLTRTSSNISQTTGNRESHWLPVASSAPYEDIKQYSPSTKFRYDRVKDRTYTTPAMLLALERSIRYVIENNIPGSVVECGVWRGGSLRAAAEVLVETGQVRDLWGYDTFRGHWEAPSDRDRLYQEPDLNLSEVDNFADESDPLIERKSVSQYVLETGFPEQRLFLIEGLVQLTLPKSKPSSIAILRLDTDLYESTRIEMEILFPRLSTGGVLIVDDYGKFRGATEAIDEYLSNFTKRPLVNRIEGQGCLLIKN